MIKRCSLNILLESETLRSGISLLDERFGVFVCLTRSSGDVVVDSGKGAVGSANLSVGIAKTLECLWRGHLVNKVTVDIDEAGAIGLLVDEV